MTKRKVNVFGTQVSLMFLSVLGGLFLTTVFLAIASASSGAKLQEIENENAILEEENRAITQRIVSESSLSQVAKKAEELGFTKPEEIVYLSTQKPVANR